MKAKPKERSLLVHVANVGDPNSVEVHTKRSVALGRWGDSAVAMAAVICRKQMYAAGCPVVRSGEVKRVRVTIREVKK